MSIKPATFDPFRVILNVHTPWRCPKRVETIRAINNKDNYVASDGFLDVFKVIEWTKYTL
jgi:hypothetical protein